MKNGVSLGCFLVGLGLLTGCAGPEEEIDAAQGAATDGPSYENAIVTPKDVHTRVGRCLVWGSYPTIKLLGDVGVTAHIAQTLNVKSAEQICERFADPQLTAPVGMFEVPDIKLSVFIESAVRFNGKGLLSVELTEKTRDERSSNEKVSISVRHITIDLKSGERLTIRKLFTPEGQQVLEQACTEKATAESCEEAAKMGAQEFVIYRTGIELQLPAANASEAPKTVHLPWSGTLVTGLKDGALKTSLGGR